MPAAPQAHAGGGINRESRKWERTTTTKMGASASLFERVGGLPVISRFQGSFQVGPSKVCRARCHLEYLMLPLVDGVLSHCGLHHPPASSQMPNDDE